MEGGGGILYQFSKKNTEMYTSKKEIVEASSVGRTTVRYVSTELPCTVIPWDSDMSVATGTQKRMSALVVSFLTF